MLSNVGPTKSDKYNRNFFVGYVFTPATTEQERHTYIQNCFGSQSVAVLDEQDQYHPVVGCPKHVLEELVFPANQETGMPLWIIEDQMTENKYAFGLWDNTYRRCEDREYLITKNLDSGAFAIQATGDEGQVRLSLSSDHILAMQAERIDVLASMGYKVISPSITNITKTQRTQIQGTEVVQQTNEEGYSYDDGTNSIRIREDEVTLTRGEVEIKVSNDGLVVKNSGNDLKDILDSLVSSVETISNTKVVKGITTTMPPAPLPPVALSLMKVSIDQLKNKIKGLFS